MVLIALLTVAAQPLIAQEPSSIEIGKLPDPPAEIGALVKQAQVSFEAGPRRPGDRTDSDRRIIAETHYRIGYKYSSQSNWRVTGGGRKLIVNVRYSQLQWRPTHTVWFRNRPADQGFWSNRLVLHELDHVRISNDPRFARRFEQRLREQPVLEREIRSGQVVSRRFVDSLVDRHVETIFQEVADLIAIRYRELDRLTGHGMRPIPTDSEMNRWLDQAGSEIETSPDSEGL